MFGYGAMNGHAVGVIMKEMVRRVIGEIREQRFDFTAETKVGLGSTEDFVTSVDKFAQALYEKLIKESFPTFGIVGEEAGLRVACREPGVDIYFTVDPLDGTKAFMRGQSNDVATQIALVVNGEVAAAYVGDINTEEIYGYRPDSDRVWRIHGYRRPVPLGIDTARPLREQYALLRAMPDEYASPLVERFARRHERGGAVKNIEVLGGSIATTMARLWKGEAGAVLLQPGPQTPWDLAPVYGISKKLGFEYMRIRDSPPVLSVLGRHLLPIKPNTWVLNRDLLVVHASRVSEVREWLAQEENSNLLK